MPRSLPDFEGRGCPRPLVGKLAATAVNRLGPVASAPKAIAPAAPLSLRRSALVRAELRLSLAERQQLQRQASGAGVSLSRYVAALLLAVDAGRTCIAGKDAIASLVQSNYQIAWLGRNLQAIARALEACPGQDRLVDARQLQDAAKQLTAHLARAGAVLAHVEATRYRASARGGTVQILAHRTARAKTAGAPGEATPDSLGQQPCDHEK